MKKARRDSGRQRLYDAEDASRLIKYGKKISDVEGCQRYVDNILRSKWFKKRYPKVSEITVRQYRGFGAQYEAGGVISIGKHSMGSPYLLHEITHHAVTINVGHGWEFAGALLGFVRRFLGKEAYIKLRENYKKHGVKYFAPKGKYEKR